MFDMKRFLFFISAVSLSLLCGCSSNKPIVYQFGETYTFGVLFIDAKGDTIDNCEIKMKPGKASPWGQYGLRYDYDSCIEYPAYEENTSYSDNESGIELHPPRMGALAFTGILPYPTYSYPVGCIVSASGEIDIKQSTFTQSSGKTIQYKYEQQGIDTIQFRGNAIGCYMVQGENTSHHQDIGHYHVTYWFHPQYGFLRWEYILPKGNIVEISLK